MTPDQFKQRLKDLHVSQSGFARLVYVHDNTVSKWATGQAKIPGPVVAYLDLADGVAALTSRFGVPRR